jgi:hypothetical protein
MNTASSNLTSSRTKVLVALALGLLLLLVVAALLRDKKQVESAYSNDLPSTMIPQNAALLDPRLPPVELVKQLIAQEFDTYLGRNPTTAETDSWVIKMNGQLAKNQYDLSAAQTFLDDGLKQTSEFKARVAKGQVRVAAVNISKLWNNVASKAAAWFQW